MKPKLRSGETNSEVAVEVLKILQRLTYDTKYCLEVVHVVKKTSFCQRQTIQRKMQNKT